MASTVMDYPVTEVKGIGKQKADELQSLGIYTVGDLIFYFPYRYEDYRIKDLTQIKDEERVTLQGNLLGNPSVQFYGRKKSRMSAKLVVDHLVVTATWFNQHFLKNQLVEGQEVVVTGKWDQRRLQITVAETSFPGSPKADALGTLQPIYSVGGSIQLKWLRKAIRQALDQFGQAIEEILPEELVRKYRLVSRRQAVRLLHYPEDGEAGRQARRRMAYEELFLFQLKLQAFRVLQRKKGTGIPHQFEANQIATFIQSLPFQLTEDQTQVIRDILSDMQAPAAMNRLVQGDVGSGKTVLAAIAFYAAFLSGYQSAYMAPTEILAEQHAETMHEYLNAYDVEIALLKGSLTEKQKRDLVGQLRMGMVDVIVGTHALIQENVDFYNLGLVVTDEQHRLITQHIR